MRGVRKLCALAVLGLLAVVVHASPAEAASPQTIYMNASGDDANDGATPGTAVASLARVQQLVAAGPLDADVEVRVHVGPDVQGRPGLPRATGR